MNDYYGTIVKFRLLQQCCPKKHDKTLPLLSTENETNIKSRSFSNVDVQVLDPGTLMKSYLRACV